MLAPTFPYLRRAQQRRVRHGVGPATATVEGTVASVDTADLDGQEQVLGVETEPADEAEWPYDWRKQLRVAFCFSVGTLTLPTTSIFYGTWHTAVAVARQARRMCGRGFVFFVARDLPGLRTAVPFFQDDVQMYHQRDRD